MRLLKLPEEIRKYLGEGKISAGHARALLKIKEKETQLALCKRIIDEYLSVRDIEKITTENSSKKKAKKIKEADPNIAKVETQLKEIFGTKVSIQKKGQKGTITLEYYSDEELNRLIDMLIAE